jgi:lipopolysaccharide export system protein LptA
MRDDKKGLTVYEGDVIINQGTIHIKADKVTVITIGKKVSRIICTGVPAYYQQLPNDEEGLVIARANTIEYQLETDVIQLVENASLEQDGATLRGDRIDYDLKKEMVNARGDISGKQRIQMFIPPSQQKETE